MKIVSDMASLIQSGQLARSLSSFDVQKIKVGIFKMQTEWLIEF